MALRIMVDLDGTICYTKKEGERYEDVLPLPGAVESLKALKARGYYIIIATARNMRTYAGNLGQVNKAQAGLITNWLERYEIPYDELYLGKAHVDYFIDDKNIKFNTWEETMEILEENDTTI